jgi:hypothetical protein
MRKAHFGANMYSFFYLFFFFLLNSGPGTCQAGALPLEPHHLPFILGVFFWGGVVLGLELGAFTLSHSTSPVFVKMFWR